MLIGHISMAYFARARWPRASMVALVVATMLPDLADFALPQGDRCHGNCGLWTHAFPAFIGLAILAAVFAWAIWHRRQAAYLAAALVFSHVALDLLTGYKQFWIGGPDTGFVLYRRAGLDLLVECTMMCVAWVVLRRKKQGLPFATHPLTLLGLLALQASFDAWLHLTH